MKNLVILMVIFLAILNIGYASTNSVTSSDWTVIEWTSSNDSSSWVSWWNPWSNWTACTMEYNPVCGEINICLPQNWTWWISNQMCRLWKESKTFWNECQANIVNLLLVQ